MRADQNKIALIDTSRYAPPAAPGKCWTLPDALGLVADLAACGHDSDRLLDEVLGALHRTNHSVLLAAIVASVKAEPTVWAQWQASRAIFEEAKLIETENALIELSKRQPAIAKFVYQKLAQKAKERGKTAKAAKK